MRTNLHWIMFDIDLVHRNYVTVRIVWGFSMDIKARRQTNRHIKGLIVKCSWSYKNEMQIIMTIYKANVKSSQKEIQAEININNILWRPTLNLFE